MGGRRAAGDLCLPSEANEPIKVNPLYICNLLLPRRYVMKEERIIIIDEGIDEVNPDGWQACCWGPLFAFRG